MPATALPILGPCDVLYGPAGAEEDLGFTRSVTPRITEAAADVVHDQTGTSPWDRYTTGKAVEIEMTLDDLSYELWEKVSPTQATVYSSGPTPTPSDGDDALDYQLGLGTSHRENAQRLILKPYVNGVASSNEEDWIVFPLVYLRVEAELSFDAETQRGLHVIGEVFPVSKDNPRLFFMGSEALLPA